MQITQIKQIIPNIYISQEAKKQLLTYLSTEFAKKKEFCFMGKVNKANDHNYLILEIMVVPQEDNSGAYCSIDEKRYAEFLEETVPIARRHTIRMHGHSHVNMGVSPSGTDTAMFKQLIEQVDDYFIQLIVNLKGDRWVALYDKQANIIMTGLPLLDISEVITKEQLAAAEATLKTMCKEKVIAKGPDYSRYSQYRNYVSEPYASTYKTTQDKEAAEAAEDIDDYIVNDYYGNYDFEKRHREKGRKNGSK